MSYDDYIFSKEEEAWFPDEEPEEVDENELYQAYIDMKMTLGD